MPFAKNLKSTPPHIHDTSVATTASASGGPLNISQPDDLFEPQLPTLYTACLSLTAPINLIPHKQLSPARAPDP